MMLANHRLHLTAHPFERLDGRWLGSVDFQCKGSHEIIDHERLGIALHLFISDHKSEHCKARPSCTIARYDVSHTGSRPTSVV